MAKSKATTFSNRQNAKRAAEKAIVDGSAPSIDYGIKAQDNRRFEIVWHAKAPATEAVETEIATATAEADMDSNPFARIEAAEAVENPHARFAAEGVTAGPEADTETGKPVETEVPEPEPDPFPKGTRVRVAIAGQISRKKYKLGTVEERGGSSQWRVLIDGEPSLGVYTCGQLSLLEAEPAAPVALELPAEAPRARPERKPRAAPSGDRKPSKSAELDAAAARGEMPTKTVMTSKSNPHYQARFDKLEALAQAGDWDAVRGYQVKGINSYAKMVAAYRDRLLAAHAASEARQ